MGILKRLMTMSKAAAHETLDKLENPTMMMNHYIRDLEEQINKAEETIYSQQVKLRVLARRTEDLQQQVALYEQKAEQAIAEGRDEEARVALQSKLLYSEQSEATLREQEWLEQANIELAHQLEVLREEKNQLQQKRTELTNKLQKVNAHSSHSFVPPTATYQHKQSARQGFERIEHKIMEWEAEQEVRSNAVEAELQRLKQQQRLTDE
ncbi:PspA/IM30 family protein [Paenibacillus yanchengensis]|uniref:PspA/IM30 family protein n=1 Tax=Paenibacillus yanchengensis TaxID=2035833 RepID=A0ABW4YGT4_9BACL